MICTPTIIQVFSKSGNLLTSCVVEYEHIDEALEAIENQLDFLGYTYKVSIPHTLESLQTWLRNEIKDTSWKMVEKLTSLNPIGPL
jgi:hypothetical protein